MPTSSIPSSCAAPEGGEPLAKRPSTGEAQHGAVQPALLSPEATAAALGDAALAAAADAAGMRMGGGRGMPSVDAMHSFLEAAYGGQREESSGEEEEPDV